MLLHPFPLLRPFQDELTVALFMKEKEDDIRSDSEAAAHLGMHETAGLHQMHGNRAIRVTGPLPRTEQADAMATDKPGLLLCIRAADCQNMVVYAPGKLVLGLLHVGWRGINAGTIPAFYSLLQREWGISPAETFVGAGPSLQQECAEFSDPLRELPSISRKFIRGRTVDLSGAADWQLQELGVPADHRERMGDCTKCRSDIYWSYRKEREAVKAGHTNMLVAALL